MSFYRKEKLKMKRKVYAFISLLIILTFIGYIIYDSISAGRTGNQAEEIIKDDDPPDLWKIENELQITDGQLLSVAVSENGNILLGGDSFLASFDELLSSKWKIKMPGKITALSVYGDTVYAASGELLFLVGNDGRMIAEWGPYEANSIITSVFAGKKLIAFADAGAKRIFILRKDGEVISMLGQGNDKFIIPSPYFDVALTEEDMVFAANTGHRRIEKWSVDGIKRSQFGEPGTAPGAFCGCCNPAHFAVIPQGFVTAEKGINRIKILGADGEFIEFVSSKNSFTASSPLDVASTDGEKIYAANPADSKLYVFIRKDTPLSLQNKLPTLLPPNPPKGGLTSSMPAIKTGY